MKTIIYYFSGRGNSCRTAMELSKRLENSEICFMRKSEKEIASDVDCIGIVAPVIDFGLPAYVEKFIGSLELKGRKPYVFTVLTFGGMPCASMLQFRKSLKRKGLEPGIGFAVKFGLEPYSDDEWKKLLDAMTAAIKERKVEPLSGISFKDKLLTALLNPLARWMIPNEDKKFRLSEACNSCGVCASVCPTGNIRIVDGRPAFAHKCQQCAACFVWCPKEAITGTNLAAKTRYVNPHVTLKQISVR